MASATLALQKAIYAALDSALSVPITDAPASPDLATPYVTIDSATSIPWDTLTTDGEEVTVTLSAWTGGESRGKEAVLGLLGDMRDALHEEPITVTGYAPIIVRVDFQDVFVDPDGVTQHGVLRVKANLRA
jgi:hypothetical protein